MNNPKKELTIIAIALVALIMLCILVIVVYESYTPTIIRNILVDMNGDGILDFVKEAKVFLGSGISITIP